MTATGHHRSTTPGWGTVLWSVVQIASVAAFVSIVCHQFATVFFSPLLWETLAPLLGGHVRRQLQGIEVDISLARIGIISFAMMTALNTLSLCLCHLLGRSPSWPLKTVIVRNGMWSLPLAVWSGCWFLSPLVSIDDPAFLSTLAMLAVAVSLAGWLQTPCRLALDSHHSKPTPVQVERRSQIVLWGCVLLSVSIFTAMNWGLWFNLRIPHGDSAMYEEHLWNLTHGKGFRSYLDQGLFLGEHIQVIHLLLIPVYLIWPSHLLLEFSESLALGFGAIPTYLLARRYSGSPIAALLVAGAYLLYFPLHYLDIAIDLKTFRPIAFGVPLMLWAILAIERRNWWQALAAGLLSLACKEDYAIVIAPLGLWVAWDAWRASRQSRSPIERSTVAIGLLTALLSTGYLLFVVKYAIPWFRSGDTVHYARYFEEFGETPTEIALTMLTNPTLLLGELVTAGSCLYLLLVLVPLGMPWRGLSQLLVGLPLFVLLCLNNLSMNPPGPFHHFHAPLVPIVIWAACASLKRASSLTIARHRARWIFCCSLSTAVFFSFIPVSLQFWDPGRRMYWKHLYLPDERAEQFSKVMEQLPQDARVASTDYVHARLTHFERSYDFSDYPRAVANYEDRVPDDTEYIVLDRQHEYSRGKYDDLSKISTIQGQLDDWEVLPDQTNGYFTILRRKSRPEAGGDSVQTDSVKTQSPYDGATSRHPDAILREHPDAPR